MRRRVLLSVLLIAIAGAAFAGGRASAGRHRARAAPVRLPPGSYAAGYRAGREDAFSGFDGGWIIGDPYIVTLAHGGPGITYRFARRWPVLAGQEYRTCDRDIICSRPR